MYSGTITIINFSNGNVALSFIVNLCEFDNFESRGFISGSYNGSIQNLEVLF